MVLLKNQGAVLPLQSPAQTIAVIGGPAMTPDALYTYNGGGSGHIPEAGYKANVVTPLTGMQTLAATKTDVVTFANGNGPGFADAIAAAKTASVAVVFASPPRPRAPTSRAAPPAPRARRPAGRLHMGRATTRTRSSRRSQRPTPTPWSA